MTENEIATIIVDVAYGVHKQLGPGLLESVYEAIMANYESVDFAQYISKRFRSFTKKSEWTSAFAPIWSSKAK